MLIAAIPVVNIIMLFIWGFGSDTAFAKRNWARAQLIWVAVAIAVWVLIFVLAAVAGNSMHYQLLNG